MSLRSWFSRAAERSGRCSSAVGFSQSRDQRPLTFVRHRMSVGWGSSALVHPAESMFPPIRTPEEPRHEDVASKGYVMPASVRMLRTGTIAHPVVTVL